MRFRDIPPGEGKPPVPEEVTDLVMHTPRPMSNRGR